jgi:hypothetical protein
MAHGGPYLFGNECLGTLIECAVAFFLIFDDSGNAFAGNRIGPIL